MKADISRNTFAKEKHYSSVRLQQGRVQMDADWNEQQDIIRYQGDTRTLDIVGDCGGPVEFDGFGLAASLADYTAEVQARPGNQDPPVLGSSADFFISAGRYYVDGILVENENITTYETQAHFFGSELDGSGTYIAYLDVWEKHVSALEDSAIRETALGGPDTASRSQTIWQVRLVNVSADGTVACNTDSNAYNAAIAAPTGIIAARAEPTEDTDSPCIIPADAGYRRLENQLYRVEVHESGNRGHATFKWSRDNGSVVARWDASAADKITVSNAGKDKYLSFAAGQWIELIDDERVLRQQAGTLVRILSVVDRVITIDTTTADGPYDITAFESNPKVRRWDSDGLLTPSNMNWLELEDGVQISVRQGSFRSGDYWLIPARTNTHSIEWPLIEGTNNPLYQAPEGTVHHNCRLAVMEYDGSTWTSITDCRRVFPPLTQLISLKYLGGDGQEAMPDTASPATLIPLDAPLLVGVVNGGLPLANALIRFEITQGNGELNGTGNTVDVLTDSEGVAECIWALDGTTDDQRVSATLLEYTADVDHPEIYFNANLSRAALVSYQPGCEALSDIHNVQHALDELCRLFRRCTTFSFRPGDDFRSILENMKDGIDASICFAVGDYILDKPLIISNKGHLKFVGAGFGTRFLAPKSEMAIVFKNCHSVIMRDFCAEAGAVGTEGEFNTLQGPITVLDTAEVSAEHLKLTCASGDNNAATCLTIHRSLPTDDTPSYDNVNVSHCIFSIGHYQTGLLIINAARALVNNNTFKTEQRPADADGNIEQNVAFKGIVVAGHFLEHADINDNSLHYVGEGIRVALSDTDEEIEMASKVTIKENVIYTYVVPPRENSDTGIFVGNAKNITVCNNEINAQLILQTEDATDTVNDTVATTLTIDANTDTTVALTSLTLARLGIGRLSRYVIANGRYTLEKGIYIHGYFGVHLNVSDNQIYNAHIGILANAENDIDPKIARQFVLWKIEDNVAAASQFEVRAHPEGAYVINGNIRAWLTE